MLQQQRAQGCQQLFAPVFFVLMGMQVNLSTFAQPDTVLLAVGFIVVAIIGKVVAGYTVRGLDRLTIGIGMVPRGEVGLIFASVGRKERIRSSFRIDRLTPTAFRLLILFLRPG